MCAAGDVSLDPAGDGGVKRGERQVEVGGFQFVDRLDGHSGHGLVDGLGLDPRGRFLVGPPCRTLGGGHGGNFEPRVVSEQGHEALTDRAGGAQNRCAQRCGVRR